jgi:sulfide:quinone oxidoreductase
MRRLLVLGGGTAGTMLANRLRQRFHPREWQVTIVDDDERHFYQPGFLFIPFGACAPADVVKTKRDLIHDGVVLLPGRPVPLPSHMSMAGKHQEE